MNQLHFLNGAALNILKHPAILKAIAPFPGAYIQASPGVDGKSLIENLEAQRKQDILVHFQQFRDSWNQCINNGLPVIGIPPVIQIIKDYIVLQPNRQKLSEESKARSW